MIGNYNGWSEELQDCKFFDQLTDFEGWWAVEIPYTDNEYAKPVCLDYYGNFNWANQCGGVETWIRKDGLELNLYTYAEDEVDVNYPQPGVYIYELTRWHNDVKPCAPPVSYTINFYAPYLCEDTKPVVSGDFNNWDKSVMTPAEDSENKTYWTLTFDAFAGTGYKFRLNTDRWWETQLLKYEWGSWNEFPNFTLGDETTITLDYSDVTKYRMGDCRIPITFTNLQVTPLGRDSILFEWEADNVSEYETFAIRCYDQYNNELFRWFTTSDQRSIRVKAGVATETTIHHWTVSMESFSAQGEGFTIPGDERLPHNIQFTSNGNNLYTLSWEGGSDIDHYTVDFSTNNTYLSFDTKETSYQFDLGENYFIDVIIRAKDAEGTELGNAEAERYAFRVRFYPPTLCDEVVPSLSGDFNNWGVTEMTAASDEANKECFISTVLAAIDSQYKIRGNKDGWKYQLLYQDGDEWREFSNFTFSGYYVGVEITMDYSDAFTYRFGPCEPPKIEQAKATVLVPSDCGMDISNGMWICWWPGWEDEYDVAEKHYEKMIALEGNKFEATFAPNDYAYGYFFLNAESLNAENVHRTYSWSRLTDAEKCYEVAYNTAMYHSILEDSNCSKQNHDYRPANLQAVNTSRDTVRFSWNTTELATRFRIRLYDENKTRIFNRTFYPEDMQDNTYTTATGFAEAKHITSWEVTAYVDIFNYGTVAYISTGEGFDIAGDARQPHNLTVTDDGDNKYTVRWEGDPEVHHYKVALNGEENTTTETSYQFTLEDNNSYWVYVYALNEAEDIQYGEANINFETYAQEPRDLNLRFYMPDYNRFIGEAGGAVKWHDEYFAGDHIIALEADPEAGHWYSAVIKDYKRNNVLISLLNAPTAEESTEELELGGHVSRSQDMAPYKDGEGKWTMALFENMYPLDLAPYDLQVTQKDNRLQFSWAANDTARNYYCQIYRNGEWYTSGYAYSNDGLQYSLTLNNTEQETITWDLWTPVNGNLYAALELKGEPFIAAPSPFIPTNLKAVENADGTFTFSWSPSASDSVQMYTLQVYDPSGSQLFYENRLTDTTRTRAIKKMYSGTYRMRVGAYSKDGRNYLGQREQTFEVAPAPEHDITIRVLINPCSGYETVDGVRFYIADKPNNYRLVDAAEEPYCWWSYKLTTDQYGAYLRMENAWGSVEIYGDVCLEYLNGEYLVDAYCDARASDYMPHHLKAEPNSDGSYTLTWLMDLTERVDHYAVNIYDEAGNHLSEINVKEMQAKTGVLRKAGNYMFYVDVFERRNYKRDDYSYSDEYQIGSAHTIFNVDSVEEREIVIRVLEQPAEENWRVYQYIDSLDGYYPMTIEKDEKPHWHIVKTTSTDPAIAILFVSRYGNYYQFTVTEDICFEVDKNVHVAACDAERKSYKLTNLLVDNPGNGSVTLSWECPINPDYFYVQLCSEDSVPLMYSYRNGDTREYKLLLNNDSAMNYIWYVVPVKIEEGQTYNEDWGEYEKHQYTMFLNEFLAYGEPFRAEEQKYVPKNLKATPNANATWTITWDAVPEPVTRYQVRILHPDGNNDYEMATEPSFVTDALWRIGNYQAYVYAYDDRGVQYGWQYVNFQVAEAADFRDIKVRVLFHPDMQQSPQEMWFETSEDEFDMVEPVDELNGWYAYSFQTKMPAARIDLMGYEWYVSTDTCLEYMNGLRTADCNAVPHDYRIDQSSLKAESEPGKVTFFWSAKEKADLYKLELYTVSEEYGYSYISDYINTIDVYDTTYTYLVPDNLDGKKMAWCVQPYEPHRLSSVWASEYTKLQKNVILLSGLTVTTQDSIAYHFAWTSNTDTVQYELRINLYGNEDQPVRIAQLTQPQFDYTFLSASARYGWQVRAVNEAGEPLSVWVYAEDLIAVKPELRAITNLSGDLQEKNIVFTWDAPNDKAIAGLYYYDLNNRWYHLFSDSIVDGHSFTYETLADGRYEFSLQPYVEVAEGKYTTIGEYNYVYVNVFTTKTFHVEVSATTGGRIYDNPTGDYPENYHLWINAGADEHYQFVRWSDGAEYANRELVVTSDTSVIALFERRAEYTLVLDATEGGVIRLYDSEEPTDVTHLERVFEQGNGIWCQAVNQDGYAFYRWSDNVTDVERWIDVTSDTTITAIFRPIRYATITASEGGRVQVSGALDYDRANKRYACLAGETLSIKAIPDEGYRFNAWSDGDKNVSRSVIITADTLISASFELATEPIQQFVVRVLSENTELGEVNQVSGTYNEGDRITIIATPKQFSVFTQWSDGDKQPTRVITVTSDTVLIASFDYKKITLTITASEGGTVNDTTANGTYLYGTYVFISATPDEHYQFIRWSDGDTNNNRQIQLTEDTELTAIFSLQQYLVTFLNADGSYIESHNYNYGDMPECSERPTLEDDEQFHYVFTGWAPQITIVTANAVYTAVYDKVPKEPQGVEDVFSTTEDDTRKIIYNSQFYIIKNARIYNAQGQLVK